MRDTAREHAQTFELLSLLHFALEGLALNLCLSPFGDIHNKRRDALDRSIVTHKLGVVPFARNDLPIASTVLIKAAVGRFRVQQLKPDAVHFRTGGFGDDECCVPAHCLGRRETEDRLRSGIPERDTEIGIPFDDADGRLRVMKPQPPPGFAKRIVRLLARGDVAKREAQNQLIGVVLCRHG